MAHQGAAAAAGAGAGAVAFRPKDHELIDRFLRPKLAGRCPDDARLIIYDADLFSAPPEELVLGRAPVPTGDIARLAWYFFTPLRGRGRRKSRVVVGDGGCWLPSSYAKPVMMQTGSGGAAVVVGYRQHFQYKSRGFLTPWLMTEYAVFQDGGEEQMVMCKVFKSPRPLPPRLAPPVQ